MNKPKVLDALLVVVIFVVAAFYAVVTLSTNDPAWMWPFFSGEPSKIVLCKRGQTTEITPDSPHYETINSILNHVLSRIKGYDEGLGLSEDSLADYRTNEVILEVFYPQPVVVHSRFNFGRPNTLLIPLTGRHSQESPVFGGIDSDYWPGALTLRDLQLLKDKLAELGYL